MEEYKAQISLFFFEFHKWEFFSVSGNFRKKLFLKSWEYKHKKGVFFWNWQMSQFQTVAFITIYRIKYLPDVLIIKKKK